MCLLLGKDWGRKVLQQYDVAEISVFAERTYVDESQSCRQRIAAAAVAQDIANWRSLCVWALGMPGFTAAGVSSAPLERQR